MFKRLKSTMAGLAAAAAVMSAGAAPAADANQAYAIDGPGLMTCGQFVELANNPGPDLSVVAGWVAGYITGHNRLMEDTFDLTPWQSLEIVLTYLKALCAQTPDSRMEGALQEFVAFLAPNRVTTAEEQVQMRSGADVVFVYPSTINAARGWLTALGYTPGEDVSEAVRQYQLAKGLVDSGLLDQRTLLSLFQAAQGAAQ